MSDIKITVGRYKVREAMVVLRQSLKLTQGRWSRNREAEGWLGTERFEKAEETRESLCKIMKPGFAGGQALLGLLYPLRRSHVLPKTVEAKTEKLFLAEQHARIGIFGRAELS